MSLQYCGQKVISALKPMGGQEGPARLPSERWIIEAMTPDRLLRRDIIGWGYTLSLPMSACRPGPAVVRLKLRYLPVQGTPVSSDSELFTLSCEEANAKGH